jgi:hypothetical protein
MRRARNERVAEWGDYGGIVMRFTLFTCFEITYRTGNGSLLHIFPRSLPSPAVPRPFATVAGEKVCAGELFRIGKHNYYYRL